MGATPTQPRNQWIPRKYAGGESVIFPNGLVLKQGSIVANASPKAVAFGAAFGTAVTCVLVTNEKATYVNDGTTVGNVTVNGFSIWNSDFGTIDNYYWQAWGH